VTSAVMMCFDASIIIKKALMTHTLL